VSAAGGTRWKPYPAHKDSGVAWLGEVPSHWNVQRLKYACHVSPSKSEIAQFPNDTQVSFLPMELIGDDGSIVLTETRTIEDVWQGYTYFREGDVIIAKITPCFENGKGAFCQGLTNKLGFGTTELYVLRAESKTDPLYIFYLTITQPFRVLGTAAMYGAAGQQRVPESFVEDFRMGFPPIPEQRAIATFLDRETARIDALTAKKERLIELLQEKRAALISHAVTKGLDPDAEMKDSGVAWLGEVPAGWEVKRLKFVSSESLQYGANEAAQFTDPNQPRFIRITDIDENGSLREDTFRSLPEDIARPYFLREGDILLARSGATVGKSFMYQSSWGRACYAGYLIRIRPELSTVEPKFISYFTSSKAYWNWISSIFIQATIQNVSAEKYANLSFAVPPLNEQLAIVAHLNRETDRIDALIAKVREAIDKLHEYRIALITAAVTGKIDVRGEV
jgi:restriction endonuclease S subunit